MKKKIIQMVLVTLGIVIFNLFGCQPDQKPITPLIPHHPIQQGVSAPFAGFIGDWMLVGGGCNFPDIPAAEGGTKVYYSNLFASCLQGDSLSWNIQDKLPQPIAYGATVETRKGLICIGGMNEDTSLTTVYRLQLDPQTTTISIEQLPSLPETMDNAAAACIGDHVYVTGGNQGNGGQALYTLCLDKDTTWTKLADYPGTKRIQPVLLASDDTLFLFGGFEVDAVTKEAVISSDYLTYSVENDCWGKPQPFPRMGNGSRRALVGAAGVRVNNLLVLAGGVNYSIFKAAVEGKAPTDYMKRPAEWYQFSKDVLIYDLQTNDWKVIGDVNGFNKAGGSLLHHDGSLYMVCGESKPGIRTNEIITKSLKGLLVEK